MDWLAPASCSMTASMPALPSWDRRNFRYSEVTVHVCEVRVQVCEIIVQIDLLSMVTSVRYVLCNWYILIFLPIMAHFEMPILELSINWQKQHSCSIG